ncbi:MAG: hypothetical protein AAFP84_12600 [Actinomycetota bacterium]
MDVSPFPFHGPLDPEQVVGRDDVIGELIEQITSRRPTALIAPRRFGKTSVLRRVASELRPTSTVIEIDLYEIRSWADLAVRIDSGLAQVDADARSKLSQIAATFELNLGVVKASITGRRRADPDLTVDSLLDVIVTHARRTPTVVVFDEFSSIGRLDGAAGLLRTKLQHHYRQVGLVFAGSEPSTMRMLFSDADQPFFAQADLIELPGLDAATVHAVVAGGFGRAAPAGLADRLVSFADGHPQRTMQLADAAWRARDDATDPDMVWESALDAVRRAAASGFEMRFAAIPVAHQAVLRLVATGEPLHGSAAEVLSLSSSSAELAKRSLLDDGQITKDDHGLIVIDPVYADWLRNRFPL